MASFDERISDLAEYIVTHDKTIAPEVVGGYLADATQPVPSYLKSEERREVLREKAGAIGWFKSEAEKLRTGWTSEAELDDITNQIKELGFPYIILDNRTGRWFTSRSEAAREAARDYGLDPNDRFAWYKIIKEDPGRFTEKEKDETPGWEQRIQYQPGIRHPSQITASQEEYEKPMPPRYTRSFDLQPGDRVRVIIPTTSGIFPPGWAEGAVISARFYGERDGWYIELDKDKVSPGWQTGYGYWKQGEDGGRVEKLGGG